MVGAVRARLNTIKACADAAEVMFTHLAWIWWAADADRLMLDPRREMCRLRHIRLPDDVWDAIEARVHSNVYTDPYEAKTHILYTIVIEELRKRNLMHCQRAHEYLRRR